MRNPVGGSIEFKAVGAQKGGQLSAFESAAALGAAAPCPRRRTRADLRTFFQRFAADAFAELAPEAGMRLLGAPLAASHPL